MLKTTKYEAWKRISFEMYNQMREDWLLEGWLNNKQYATTPMPDDPLGATFDRMRFEIWAITWMDVAKCYKWFSRSCNRI